MKPREAALLTRTDDAVIGELMEWAGAVLLGLPKAVDIRADMCLLTAAHRAFPSRSTLG